MLYLETLSDELYLLELRKQCLQHIQSQLEADETPEDAYDVPSKFNRVATPADFIDRIKSLYEDVLQ